MALQGDGGIAVAGYIENWKKNTIAGLVTRLRPNGRLDRRFGRGGKALRLLGGDHHFEAVTLQPDGKLVLGGHASPDGGNEGGALLARILPDGRPDPAFGSDGVVISDLPRSVRDVALQRDGKILVAGSSDYEQEGQPPDFLLARYDADGTLDESFGDQGRTRTDFAGEWDVTSEVALQGDDKILVVGTAVVDGRSQIGLARYTASGLLDPSFGSGGTVTTTCGTAGAVGKSVLVLPDGRILVGGYDEVSDSGSRFVLARFLP